MERETSLLRFEGVNSIANVFINRKNILVNIEEDMELFVFEITDREYGKGQFYFSTSE